MRRGHIPGAKNIFWETALEGEEVKTWKKKEELERLFAESGVTRQRDHCPLPNRQRSKPRLFYLKIGPWISKVRLYRGSWVEWSADKSMPVKTGSEP